VGLYLAKVQVIEVWVFFTLIACSIQALRTVLQKNLAHQSSVIVATYIRFLFGLPIIVSALFAYALYEGIDIPDIQVDFISYAWAGGLVQLLGNALLLYLLSFSNFTIGITYTKTEVIQTVVIGYLVLGEVITSASFIGIIIAFLGIAMLASKPSLLDKKTHLSISNYRAVACGILVGTLYALAAVFFRAAMLLLDSNDVVITALTTLAWVTFMQVFLMTLYSWYNSKGLLTTVMCNKSLGFWIALSGITASACWYIAFKIQKAAYVLALGQFELVVVFLVSTFWLKERMSVHEIIGVCLTVLGILVVLLAS
jgi:uncharacterized membrane protein